MLLTGLQRPLDDLQLNSAYTAQTWASDAALLHPCRRADIHAYPFDHEAVLFDPTTGNCHYLNDTAYSVFQLCDGHGSADAIAQTLTHRFEIDPERALDHVEQVLAVLAEAGLLEDQRPWSEF